MITNKSNKTNRKPFPASLEIKSGDTLYKVTSIYANKGDFRAIWEELIIKSLSTAERKAG